MWMPSQVLVIPVGGDKKIVHRGDYRPALSRVHRYT